MNQKSPFTLEKLKTAHVELTDRCNAACPMCVRNIHGGPENPYLPNMEITLDDFKRQFTPEILSGMVKIYFCGNYGDPALSNHLIDIARYIRTTAPQIQIGINTNGGVGSPSKWAELGSIINRSDDYCYFSIDGLEDTNHIYRRHVQWSHVMQSAESFIAAGGTAKWDFIVFKHNEHQVEEARELAFKMGFKDFCVKKSGRFFFMNDSVKLEAFPVYSRNLEYQYFIEPPSVDDFTNKIIKEYQNKNIHNYNKVFDQKLHLEIKASSSRPIGLAQEFYIENNPENQHTSRANIKCRVLNDNSIFLSSEGLVFPCCWTAFPVNSFWDNNDTKQILAVLEQTGGRKAISIHHRTLREILDGEFFHAIANSWKKTCAREGKLISCAFQCGEHLDKLSDENLTI